jgi:hypothetical protein
VSLPPPTLDNATAKLHQIADLENLLGFKGNYMVFPMVNFNYMTWLMTQVYIHIDDNGGVTPRSRCAREYHRRADEGGDGVDLRERPSVIRREPGEEDVDTSQFVTPAAGPVPIPRCSRRHRRALPRRSSIGLQ